MVFQQKVVKISSPALLRICTKPTGATIGCFGAIIGCLGATIPIRCNKCTCVLPHQPRNSSHKCDQLSCQYVSSVPCVSCTISYVTDVFVYSHILPGICPKNVTNSSLSLSLSVSLSLALSSSQLLQSSLKSWTETFNSPLELGADL